MAMTASKDAAPAQQESAPAQQEPAPANLHISLSCPACSLPPLSARVEQKFFVTPRRAQLALALLKRSCRPDPEFPVGQVNSLYFDTLDLDQHERSDSGEFAKDKIRIRWYGEEHDPHGTALKGARPAEREAPERIWVELKSRRGFASTKQRMTTEIDPAGLRFAELQRGIISPNLLLAAIVGFGFFPKGRLQPVVTISYWRYRFVEPRTGFRVSIDSRIRSSMVAPGMGNGERGLELPGVVVEVKGPRFEIPAALRPLLEIGSAWTRYSKYSSSLDGHAETMGSVSRLWPTGMLEEQPSTLAWVRRAEGDQEPAPPEPAYQPE